METVEEPTQDVALAAVRKLATTAGDKILNPLTIIRLSLPFASRADANDEVRRTAIAAVERAIARIAVAVEGLRRIAREAQGRSAARERRIQAETQHVAGLLRREQRARDRADSLARILRVAATRHEPESLVQAVAPELLAVSGAGRVVVYLAGEDAALVPVTAAISAPGEEPSPTEPALEVTPALLARLVAERRPLVDAPSLLLIPLLADERVAGAVGFHWGSRPAPPEPDLIEFLAGIAEQVSLGVENARLFARLAQLASTDELTGLANRRRFTEALRLELARARRTGDPLALVLADVDHLKQINDTFGHPAGDAAIRHVASRLRQGCREIDLAARLGGEEFGLILPGTDRAGAVAVAERIRRDLADSTVASMGSVTASMGVTTFPHDGLLERQIVEAADARLYAAKALGRNRVCAGDPATGSAAGVEP